MIIGHLNPPLLKQAIFSFHMPIFFIISGMLYKDREGIVASRFVKYAKPYLFAITGIIVVVLIKSIITSIISGFDFSLFLDIWSWVLAGCWGSMSGNFLGHDMPTVGMLWFFWALFWCVVFQHVLARVKREFMQYVLTLLAVPVSLLTFEVSGLPFSIQSALCCFLFFFAGVKGRDLFKSFNKYALLICIIIWIIDFYFCYNNKGVNFGVLRFTNIPINYLGAFAGSYIILHFSKWLSHFQNRFVEILLFWGRYSAIVMCAHFIEHFSLPWVQIIDYLSANNNGYLLVLSTAVIIKLSVAFFAIKIVCSSVKLKTIFSLK